MGSSCSGQNRTVSPTNQRTVKSKPIENAHDAFGIASDITDKPNAAQPDNELDSEETKSPMDEINAVDKAEKEIKQQGGEIDDGDFEKDGDGDEDEAGEDEGEEGKKKKREPMAEEELREFKVKRYSELRDTAKEVFALDTFRDENGEYVKIIRNACVRFYNSYHALKPTSMDEIVKYRLECAKIMIETKFADLACDVIIYTYTNGWYNEDGKKNAFKFAPLSKCLILLQNFTDCSDELTVYLTNKNEFLEQQAKILTDYVDRHLGKIEPQLKPTEEKVLYAVISIIHNLSMRETNSGPLRGQGFVQALQPYLESPKVMNRLNAVASLAGIITEEECEIINTNKSSVSVLLKVLGNCLKDKRRRSRGWSAKETGLAVRTLARNDANKKLLVELGALELLVELGKTGNTAEQYESVSAIWALCFDKETRAVATSKPELEVVELLLELKQTNDKAIQKVCNGALWTLRDDLKTSTVEKYREVGENLYQQQEKHRNDRANAEGERNRIHEGGHVMISYQWGHQELLKTIRDQLKDHGFKVWMDIDQMGGSTLQAMADAVEGADVFLMCMSNKYKNSPACRAEAEYAFQTRKKIIPLKLEAGYVADGWLGFILGAKLFFDFSGKYPFEDKLNGLLKELDSAKKIVRNIEGAAGHQSAHKVTSISGPSVSQVPNTTPVAFVKHSTKTSVAMETLSVVRNWSTDDVKKWVDANDLKSCGLDGMSGSEIAYLAKMQTDAPEFFHKFINDTLKARTVTTIAKIGWALHDLSAGH